MKRLRTLPHWSARPANATIVMMAVFCFFSQHVYCSVAPVYDFAVQPRPIEFSAVPQSQRVVEGESVRLTCNFSVTRLGSKYWKPHIVWRQNGSQLSVEDSSLTLNTVELLGGYSELVLDPVQPQHAGYYECLAVDGKKKGGEEKFGEGRYVTASPRAYIDIISSEVGSGSGSILGPDGTETVTVQQGESLQVPCHSSAVSIPSRVEWYQNGTLLTINDRIEVLSNGSLLLHSVTVENAGIYQCRVWSENQTLEGPLIEVAVREVLSSMSSDETVYHIVKSNTELSLVCDGANTEYDSIYWYKNGEELSEQTSELSREANTSELIGVYQCFAQRSDGVAVYVHTWRVFDIVFTNPPTNLKCKVKFNPNRYLWPLVEIQWEPPDFIAADQQDDYIVYSDNGLQFSNYVIGLYTEIELDGVDDIETIEEVYKVFVATSIPGGTSSPARCDFNTVERALDPPLPLKTTCPTTPGNSVIFKWTNPLARGSFNVDVRQIKISAICLYGNHSIYRPSWLYDADEDYDYYDDLSADQPDFNLTLTTSSSAIISTDDRVIPNGTVCVATGSYLLDHPALTSDRVVRIPTDICLTPPPEQRDEAVRLGLSCSGGVVGIYWNTSLAAFTHTDNITLHTSCLNSDDRLEEVFSVADAGFAGGESVGGVSSNTLCTFYGWYTDARTSREETIPPAQCYMDQPADRQFYAPVNIPNSTVYSTTYTPSMPASFYPSLSSANSMASSTPLPTVTSPTGTIGSVQGVLQIVIPSVVGLIAILTVVSCLLVLRYRQSTRYNTRNLHYVVDKSLDKTYNPFRSNFSDDVSIKTEFDDGEYCGEHAPSEVSLDTKEVESVTESTAEDTSEGLKDRETPVMTPLISDFVLVADDSGCILQTELCLEVETASEGNGKEHIFTKFLSDISDENSGAQVEQTETTIKEHTLEDTLHRERPLEATPPGIAEMVAHRVVVVADSEAPSSGYGTTDGYKYSTDASEVSRDYLARKLRDVEEVELDSISEDTSNTTSDTDENNIMLDTANEHTVLLTTGSKNSSENAVNHLPLESTDNRLLSENTDNRLPSESTDNHLVSESTVTHLPSVLLTTPSHHPDSTVSTCISLTRIDTAASADARTANNGVLKRTTNSASTGDISCRNGSYYKDKEGYLHMGPLQTVSQHHQSSELVKSL